MTDQRRMRCQISSVFGDSPSGCFTELLSTRSVVHSDRDQFTGPKSNKIFCIFWVTSLFALSAIPFSSLEYGIVVWR